MATAKRGRRPYQAGVIDVGAHSVRLDLFEVASDGRIELLESLSQSINLGYDVFRHGSVSPENLARLTSVMAAFARKLAEYRIRRYRVIATSAVREAFNRELVVNRIRNESGLELEVLETQEEIRITYLSMREALNRHMRFEELNGICLMIGAGSLLVSYFDRGLMRFSEEVPLGTVRLFDAYGRTAVSMDQVLETLRSQDIRQRLFECVGLEPGCPLTLIALGASVRQLVSVLPEGGAARGEEVWEMAAEFAEPAVRRIMHRDPAALAAELKLTEESAAGIAVCGGILSYFLEEFNCRSFLSPATTTRTALIEDLVRRSRPEPDPFHGDLIAICDSIGRKYGYDPIHAEEVSRLCLQLLGKLGRKFEFPARAPLLLEAAARLHDIGRFVDTRQHHKHSWYLISNMQLPGISEAEQNLVAVISRYHRKATPKTSHPEYMMLAAEEKVTVLKLAAILRVADALECSRRGRFRKCRIVQRGGVLAILVPESGDFRLERLNLELKGGMFNEVFGLEVKIEEAPLSI